MLARARPCERPVSSYLYKAGELLGVFFTAKLTVSVEEGERTNAVFLRRQKHQGLRHPQANFPHLGWTTAPSLKMLPLNL